ncbi:hypothetical protein NP233_g4024 [Leucocoprinus birnbaumii]|uniref:Uncharacterized protein n=1 Tax=Leucocoprinus birnbaumii TaxID=56174 RepID=A0AAD5YXJ0_9AGAR|nr:hypothetical protein NP233_g4024 [Leucocoprinus birnbaumii]
MIPPVLTSTQTNLPPLSGTQLLTDHLTPTTPILPSPTPRNTLPALIALAPSSSATMTSTNRPETQLVTVHTLGPPIGMIAVPTGQSTNSSGLDEPLSTPSYAHCGVQTTASLSSAHSFLSRQDEISVILHTLSDRSISSTDKLAILEVYFTSIARTSSSTEKWSEHQYTSTSQEEDSSTMTPASISPVNLSPIPDSDPIIPSPPQPFHPLADFTPPSETFSNMLSCILRSPISPVTRALLTGGVDPAELSRLLSAAIAEH